MDKELVMVTKETPIPRPFARAYQVLTSTPPPAWARTPVTVNEMPHPTTDDWSIARWAACRKPGSYMPKSHSNGPKLRI